MVTFGEVVRQTKVDADPETSGLERYVAGEHMETDDLHIRRWGTIGDGYLGPAFHRRFSKGQILYGSRRTYLRKVAVADFDGITANTTFVLEPQGDGLIPELLPFIMQTDGFNEHSVKQSRGSVNPYVNFRDIADYAFPLPPKPQQQRIAEILWAADAAVERWRALAISLKTTRNILVGSEFKRLAGESTLPLSHLCTRITDGTHQPPKFTNSGIPFFLVQTISSGRVDWSLTKFVSEDTYRELTRRIRPKRGDVLYTAVASYGIPVLVDFDEPFVFQRHIAHIVPKPEVVSGDFLQLFLSSPEGRYQSDQAAVGSAQRTVTLGSLSSFQVPELSLKEQSLIVDKAQSFTPSMLLVERRISAARNACSQLRETLLTDV